MPAVSIRKGTCPVTGYEKQSLQCANCRYNRVDNLVRFAACQKTECKTTGTVCIATDTSTQPAEKVTQNPLPKGNAKRVTFPFVTEHISINNEHTRDGRSQ